MFDLSRFYMELLVPKENSPRTSVFPRLNQKHFWMELHRQRISSASILVEEQAIVEQHIPGPSRGVQWRSLSSVGASIGDPFEGAGWFLVVCYSGGQLHEREPVPTSARRPKPPKPPISGEVCDRARGVVALLAHVLDAGFPGFAYKAIFNFPYG